MIISKTLVVDTVTSDGVGASQFGRREIRVAGDDNRQLSEQIDAVNFRVRTSPAGYYSDFHVAGDPTLLVLLSGIIRITLASGSYKEFKTGDMFVAQDYLQDDHEFRSGFHGHKAQVLGSAELKALHLKLEKR